jgi:hypothetical protein
VVASAVSLLTWIFLTAFRRHPARLLVLRRFNDKKLSRSTENLIVKQLRKFGHAVSLSDKFLRHTQRSDVLRFLGQSWLNPIVLAWIPIRLILRLFNRSKYGPIYVGDSRDYRNLAQRLRGRYTFNFEMACGTRESILIRSTDSWWKPVVAMAMASADVVIADLSDVADGTTWELERIDELNFYDKVVFIALRERLHNAKEALARYPKAFGSHIFAFDADGSVENDTAFIDSIVEAIARTCSPTVASVKDNETGASV